MRLFRFLVSFILTASAVPPLALFLAWSVAALSGCRLQFDEPHVCPTSWMDSGPTIDTFLGIGIYTLFTPQIAGFTFGLWVLVELARIIAVNLTRDR